LDLFKDTYAETGLGERETLLAVRHCRMGKLFDASSLAQLLVRNCVLLLLVARIWHGACKG